MIRSDAERFRGDEGAIMVEFALFAPVLMLLAMGVLEFGLAWSDSQTLATAMRSAARAGSNTGGGGGDNATADHLAIRAALAALGGLDASKVDRIVVYDASGDESSEGSVPSDCKTVLLPAHGFAYDGDGTCNIYGAAWLANYDASDSNVNFVTAGSTPSGCPRPIPSGSPASAWCANPTDREADQGADGGADWIGVYVQYDRDAITGMFGDGFTIRDDSAYRIEPALG